MRMHLKKRRKVFTKGKVIFILLFLGLFFYLFYILSENIGYYYLSYSEREARKIIDTSMSEAVSDNILEDIKDKDLYSVMKNASGEIEMVDYDPYLVNVFLRDVTDNIVNALEEKEDDSQNISFYIPLGSALQNPIFNNRGPKIPVRMESIGSVLTNINTKVTEYGINNCLIEMYVHIEIREKVILPVISKTITVKNDLPVSHKIIKGTVPSYYGGSISKGSNIYSIPME